MNSISRFGYALQVKGFALECKLSLLYYAPACGLFFLSSKIAIPTTIFSIARYARRLQPQSAEVLAFGPDAVELRKGPDLVERIPYNALVEIRYMHVPQTVPRMVTLLGGNLFGRRQASFRFASDGANTEVYLESDIEFRGRDLVQLFTALYAAGIPLKEFQPNGLRMFLLKQLPESEVNARIASLKPA